MTDMVDYNSNNLDDKLKIEMNYRNDDYEQSGFKKHYVYVHKDINGDVFYVGEGRDKRAWSVNTRHFYWCMYIMTRSNNKIEVEIIKDKLSKEQAEEIEYEYMLSNVEHLVNWVNMGRKSDWVLCDRYRKMKNETKDVVVKAKEIEKTNLDKSIAMYIYAFNKVKEYAYLDCFDKSGILRELQLEETNDMGYEGELVVLDRMTLCLIKRKKTIEAYSVAMEYYELFRRDLLKKLSEKIHDRIKKALVKDSLDKLKFNYDSKISELIPITKPYQKMYELSRLGKLNSYIIRNKIG